MQFIMAVYCVQRENVWLQTFLHNTCPPAAGGLCSPLWCQPRTEPGCALCSESCRKAEPHPAEPPACCIAAGAGELTARVWGVSGQWCLLERGYNLVAGLRFCGSGTVGLGCALRMFLLDKRQRGTGLTGWTCPCPPPAGMLWKWAFQFSGGSRKKSCPLCCFFFCMRMIHSKSEITAQLNNLHPLPPSFFTHVLTPNWHSQWKKALGFGSWTGLVIATGLAPKATDGAGFGPKSSNGGVWLGLLCLPLLQGAEQQLPCPRVCWHAG